MHHPLSFLTLDFWGNIASVKSIKMYAFFEIPSLLERPESSSSKLLFIRNVSLALMSFVIVMTSPPMTK